MGEGIFLAVPTYNDLLYSGVAGAIFQKASRRPSRIAVQISACSLLAYGFNKLWCTALDHRIEHQIKWFAMLHGDIVPEDWWLDKLIDEAESNDADVMSAVVPFKDNSGYTSTALSDPSNPWAPRCRLTQKQVRHPEFPKTFDAETALVKLSHLPDELFAFAHRPTQLLVNTGCFVARIDKPWAEQVHFNIADRIVKKDDGTFEAQVQSEDWQFSRRVADLGGKVMATTKVDLHHKGAAAYASTNTWGSDRDHLLAKTA